MSTPADPALWRERLSAALDGEADPSELARLSSAWREEPAVRADWHTFALIGDVLRADDQAWAPRRDRALLDAVSARLRDEPGLLAPAEPLAPRTPALEAPLSQVRPVPAVRVRAPWGGAAMAAGAALAVVGVLGSISLWRADPAAPEAVLAAKDANLVPVSMPGLASQSVVDPVAASAVGASTPQMLRNPELDRYLAAHRQFAQGPALAAPGGLRQVAVTPDGR